MKKDHLIAFLIVASVLSIVGLSVWLTAQVWHECRLQNSFFYCLKLISR